MKRSTMTLRHLAVSALSTALLLPTLAAASSSSNTKINRVRTGVDGRTYVNLVTPPASPSCPPGLAQEDFVFFSNTPSGRVLYAQVLTAYTTQALVDVFGDGTCYNVVVGQWENLSSLTIHP